MNSEFGQFLDTLKRLGIKFSINWQPDKQVWQSIIETAGYGIAALACAVVAIGNTEYLFSDGPLCWEKRQSYGPSRLFMLSKDKTSNEVRNRTFFFFNDSGNLTSLEGWRAAVAKYPDQYWGPFEILPKKKIY